MVAAADEARELLADLARRGVELHLDGDLLRYTAPAGALTPDLRARLQKAKARVIDALRHTDEATLAASLTQRRFWELQLLDPAEPFYNIPFLFRIVGPLDTGRLRKCLTMIVNRHDSLRSTLHERDRKLIQIVGKFGEVDWREADLRSLPNEAAEKLLQAEVLRPYDLTKDPLLRATLVRMASEAHLFQLCLHNVVFDMASLLVILDEISEHYAALAAERPVNLSEPVQYREFVRWQAARALSNTQRRHDYWSSWLSRGDPPVWSWPARKQPATEVGFRSLPSWTRLSPSETASLQEFCRAQGVTVYIAVLAAYLLMLRQMTGCADLTVGTTYSERDGKRFASMVGASIIVPALRVDMADDPSVPDLLRRIRGVVADAIQYQDLPLEEVIPRETRGPLFKVVCTLFPDTPHGKLRLEGVKTVWVEEWLNPISRPQLYLVIWETPAPDGMSLTCHMMHRQDIWDQQATREAADRFKTILKSIGAAAP